VIHRPLPPPPYLIVGCGRAGISATEALAAITESSQIRIWDGHDGPETRRAADSLEKLGVTVELGRWEEGRLESFPGTVIKSPGVPAGTAPVREALDAGSVVIDELELAVRLGASPLAAVTGTDGKSTVSSLLAHALGRPGSPLPVAGNTEFGPPLSAAVASLQAPIVECSSYQLEFCAGPFSELAVLTNLTPEHLHRHGTMEAYGEAKRRLFTIETERVQRAVINVDSEFGRRLAADLRELGGEVATVGRADTAEYRLLRATWNATHACIRLITPRGPLELRTRLPGVHNAENIASAVAGCDLLGVPRAETLRALMTAGGLPGRWERVDCGQRYEVIVDFAHTPAGLRHVLHTARRVAARSGGRVCLMLCAGGHNNPAKRAPLGRVASSLADLVVMTEGNGRGEPVETVMADLLADWCPDAVAPEIEPDRRLAIRRVLGTARPGDVAILMGRGAMRTLLSNHSGGGVPFDDRAVAIEELHRLARRSVRRAEVALEDQAVPAGTEIVGLLAHDEEPELGVEAH
jgi:UDP-N-acetylmuramoyl-L-alanyl-D-glutamate--2,6-diaminopimelate ligase